MAVDWLLVFPFLPIIDAVIGRYTGATTDVKEQPPERNKRVDLQISEPLLKKPKEAQDEYDISWGSEQQQGLGEADNFRNDPKEEEDSNMPSSTESYNVEVVECNTDSSATLSAGEVNGEYEDCFFSSSEESTSEGWDPQKRKRTKKVSLFRWPRTS